MSRVAVLASGRGSNLQALIDCGTDIRCVVSDQPRAQALARARAAGIEALVCDDADRALRERAMLDILRARAIDLVCLAGYMRLLSADIVAPYAGRILNIHPSLLPDLPGLHTHRRALEQGRRTHGATVHFVDETLDGGPRILYATLKVRPDDTEESLASRVLQLEHRIYPDAVARVCSGAVRLQDGAVWADGAPLPGPLQVA